MSKVWKSLLGLVVAFSTTGNAIEVMNADLINKLKKGQTSDEVRQLLGVPTADEKHGDGQHVFVYEWLESKDSAKHVWFTLLFNKQDKFIKLQSFSQTDAK